MVVRFDRSYAARRSIILVNLKSKRYFGDCKQNIPPSQPKTSANVSNGVCQ
jgi:hypothetical protein